MPGEGEAAQGGAGHQGVQVHGRSNTCDGGGDGCLWATGSYKSRTSGGCNEGTARKHESLHTCRRARSPAPAGKAGVPAAAQGRVQVQVLPEVPAEVPGLSEVHHEEENESG